MLKKIFLPLIFLVSFLIEGYAQTYPLINLTTKDGLPSNTVYSIFPDSKRYLWICTNKGLAIYNGKTFKSFSTANGLPDNEIFGVKEDHYGRIWLLTFNGELCYYKDGIFHTQANTPWLKLPFNIHIQYMNVEYDGSVTIVFSSFKNIINIKGNHITILNTSNLSKYVPKNSENMPIISIIRKKSVNRYELLTTNKIQIDTLGNLLSKQKLIHKDYAIARNIDEDYIIYIDGIYNMDQHLIYPLKIKSLNEYLSIFSRKNNFWMGSKDGLWINNSIPIIKDQFVTYIVLDKEEGYWISTREHGLYYLNKNFEEFTEWKDAYRGIVKQSRTINGTVNFITDEENIYQIEQNSIKALFSKNNKTKQNDKKLFQYLINENLDYLALSNIKSYLIKRRNGPDYTNIDISSQLKKFYPFSLKYLVQDNNYVYLFEISKLIRVNRNALFIGQIKDDRKLIEKSMDDRIYAHAINPSDHTIWISKTNGIYKLADTQLIHQKQFQRTSFREMRFYKNYLVGFTDRNHFLISNNYNTDAIIDTVRGNNCIWENIYPIDDHRAIISTNNYYRLLTLYLPSENGRPRYTIQTIEDPFVPKQAEYITADSNNCYFFKEGTITRIATPVLFSKTPSPLPVFSSFKALDKSYLIRPEIKISYDQSKSINITVDNISFVSKDITCQYSISDNGKDEWREITGNEINLNTPGYGTYLIKIRSKTLSSGYSKPAVIRLIVQKPFWATWWFISLCALALIALVWGIIVFITWRKLRKKQKEHDADMKYQQSEYKALNALMNPHFIFNSLNNIQGLINKDEKRTANEYLVIFSDLVRQNMHNISKGFISLQQELTLVENYLNLEKLRFKELVNYEIKVDEEVDIDDIMIPPLMIQPLVENAVKHGLLPKQSALSKVSVLVYEKDNLLYIVIEDNGVGLTKSLQSENKLHESFGLSNLKKRTEHLKKIQQHEINIEITELKNSDGTVKGTQAVVTLKLIEV
jgi:two-component sensor histidine kinase